MINTLKITSIVAGCLAILFFAMSAFLGLKPDEQKATIVAEAEKFGQEKLKAEAANTGNREDSPLVKQAQALALKLNPPKPVETVSIENLRPVAVARFKLIGTAYYPENIGKSIALLDVPGKGQRWVKINESIEGAQILKIFDGKIVYKEGDKTTEMYAGNKPAVEIEESKEVSPGKTQDPANSELKETVAFLKELSNKKADMNSEEAAELGDLTEFIKQVEAEANSQNEAVSSDVNSANEGENIVTESVDTNSAENPEPGTDSIEQNNEANEGQDNNDVNNVNNVVAGEDVGAPGTKE